MTIYTAVIEHMSGMDVHTSFTQEGLNKKVADYCRAHWETRSGAEPGLPPVDDEEAIGLYFEDHENDSLTTEAAECESPRVPALTPDVILDALLKRDFVVSLDTALRSAGGSLSWDRIKSQTLEELSVTLARNNVMFEHRPTNRSSQYRNFAAAVSAARPFIP